MTPGATEHVRQALAVTDQANCICGGRTVERGRGWLTTATYDREIKHD